MELHEYNEYFYSQATAANGAELLVREVILKILKCRHRKFLRSSEDPREFCDFGVWTCIEDGYFELLDSLDTEPVSSLFNWLRVGNWSFFCASSQLAVFPTYSWKETPQDNYPDGIEIGIQAYYDLEFITIVELSTR